MRTSERVRETKENGVLLRSAIIGAGTVEDPRRPEIIDLIPGAYFHADWTTELDGKIDVYVSKTRSKPEHIAEARARPEKLSETSRS